MVAVIFVRLSARANVANLLLARGARRANEFAVRNALGARQGRVVRQLLTESLVISIAGGVCGLLLATLGRKGLAVLAPPGLLRSAPDVAVTAPDFRILAFTFFVAILTTVLFRLAPALPKQLPPLAEALEA